MGRLDKKCSLNGFSHLQKLGFHWRMNTHVMQFIHEWLTFWGQPSRVLRNVSKLERIRRQHQRLPKQKMDFYTQLSRETFVVLFVFFNVFSFFLWLDWFNNCCEGKLSCCRVKFPFKSFIVGFWGVLRLKKNKNNNNKKHYRLCLEGLRAQPLLFFFL